MYFSGVGALLPYIPVFMKQLGLTPTETGIIYGVMPFIGFFVRPLFGALADKTQRHKFLLMACTLITGVLYCTLLLTPKNEVKKVPATATLHCGDNYKDAYLQDCNRTLTRYHSEEECTGEETLDAFIKHVSKPNANTTLCQMRCREIVLDKDDGTDTVNATIKVQMQTRILTRSTFTNIKVPNCHSYRFQNLSFEDPLSNEMFCETPLDSECEVICNDRKFERSCGHDTFGKTFWIFFLIFLVGNISFSPVLSLVDAIAYKLLGEMRNYWGRQRLWGTAGFALFAIGSGVATFLLSTEEADLNYTPCFILFLGLTCATCIVTFFLKLSDSAHGDQIIKDIFPLLKSFRIAVFLTLVTSFGIMDAVIEAFLGWYLIILGGNTITLGLCLVANCVPEIIMLLFSGAVIKKIGHMACFCIGLSSYMFRFFTYTFITNAWYIIPVETLHCLSYALTYAGASTYASLISPDGTSATMQGLISGLYFGFGKQMRQRIFTNFLVFFNVSSCINITVRSKV